MVTIRVFDWLKGDPKWPLPISFDGGMKRLFMPLLFGEVHRIGQTEKDSFSS
jgi:hypothetical protein